LKIAGLGPCENLVEARDGDEMVTITYSRDCSGIGIPLASPSERDAVLRLDADLVDLASWLPSGAWLDPQFTAYVPTRFAVCSGASLTTLPGAATDIIARAQARPAALPDSATVLGDHPGLPLEDCATMTTAEARAVARILADAGYAQDLQRRDFALAYDVVGPVWFEPILPHGEWIDSGAG
jgi:hypothetical protein